ncbi:MAG: ROK family protein [Spirochaetota bacterium]
MGVYIGVDLGGTNIKVVAVDRDGAIRARTRVETRDSIADTHEKTQYWLTSIREATKKAEEESARDIEAIGIAAPGLVSRDETTIATMPGRLKGLEGLNWTEELAQPRPVPVLNDAQAALLAESWLGAAVNARDAVMLTLGTGVGGAILADGHILRGRIGRAGHLGHLSLNPDGPPDICGAPGSLELMVGQATLAERSLGRFATYEELLQAYRRGDTVATDVWLQSVKALAVGIVSIINILDPEVVLLGGGISAAEELGESLKAYMDEYEWRPGGHTVPVRTAQLGPYGGAIGAARKAMVQGEENQWHA